MKKKSSKLTKKDHALIRKILKDTARQNENAVRIKTEAFDREGGRVIVEMKDGRERTFFFAEGGLMAGWNEE